MKKIILIIVLLVLIISCTQQKQAETQEKEPEQQQQIANPASVYCEEQGETLRIVDGENGQYGICTLEDGTECEEWAYYRGECPKTEIIEQPETKTEAAENKETQPKSTNSIDILSDEQIDKLGADCKSKATELEKANCILDWQEKNIFWCYTHPEKTVMPNMFETGYPDCVVDMQFQQMKPGSFATSKAMEMKIRNGRIFGACYTYATTYCAIARWNGLTCKVMAVKIITPMDYSASKGDYGAGYCGAAQKIYLDALGLDCDEWRAKNWVINEDHYWAEVLIDGKWRIMEKPTWAYMHDTQKNIIDAGRDYYDTGW